MSETPGMDEASAGKELARRTVEYGGTKRSVTQLDTMLGATKQAVAQLDFNIAKTKEEIQKLGSTNLSPYINAIARGEEYWSGDPATAGLFFFMHATAVESARILSGGQASVAQLHQGAMEEARKWANVGMTPAAFDEVSAGMHAEGQNRVQNFESAKSSQEGAFTPPNAAATPNAGAAPIPLADYLKSQGY
jgi:hypothetical protein